MTAEYQLSRRSRTGVPVEVLLCVICSFSIVCGSWFLASHAPHKGSSFRHPLLSSVPKRKAVSRENESKLRYLSFGEHHAWGKSLSNYHDAYPWQLSQDVEDVSMLVGGLTLSAVCTQTIVGDELYDVILLQYFLHAEEGLFQLAQRLRERFPSALIVIVKIWDPASFIFRIKDEQHNRESLDQFRQRHGIPNYRDPAFAQAVSATDPNEWMYYRFEKQEQIVQNIVESLGGVVTYTMPLPESPIMALTQNMDWFHPANAQALSEIGHEMVARNIREIVEQAGVVSQPLSVRNKHGTWGQGDICNMWYTTGRPPSVLHTPNIEFIKMQGKANHYVNNNSKYALEIPPEGGMITMSNPFDEPRMLYLAYMTTSPPAMVFPTMKVMLGDTPGVVILPVNDLNRPGEQHAKTTAIGLIPPGLTTVGFEAQDFGTEKNFLLAGFGLFGNVENIPIEHHLETESALLDITNGDNTTTTVA